MKIIREHKFITICVIVAVLLAVAALFSVSGTSQQELDAQADSIRDTIARRALQCYVIEKAYPESLAYLEENYGLAVNKEDFTIVYTPYAENILPDIRVICKRKE